MDFILALIAAIGVVALSIIIATLVCVGMLISPVVTLIIFFTLVTIFIAWAFYKS